MAFSKIQRAFSSGEIASALYARADTQKYQEGLRTCRNFFIQRHGGAANRTGSEFITAVKDSTAGAYFLKFVFNAEQSYLLEFGDQYIRFYRNGVQLEDPPATPYAITTPYAIADVPDLQFVQSGDVVTIVHPSYDVYELARTAHTSWTLTAVSFAPSIAAPAGPGATEGTSGSIVWRYQVTSVKAETYEESLPTAVFSCTGDEPTDADPNVLTWTLVAAAVEYNVYREVVPGNDVYGFLGVAGSNAFNDPALTPDASITPPIARNPFSGAGNRPSVAGYWQQRLALAGSTNEPGRVHTSRTGFYKNFSIRSPIQDDDAVSFTPAGRTVNAIRHLVEIGQLVILTDGGEWTVNGDADGVLKPHAINLQQHAYYGASTLRPIVIGNTALYQQARGRIVRDLAFQWESSGYRGNDLTVFSPHLFERYGIVRWDYAQIPHSIVWGVRADGTLLGLTYLPEFNVWAWHRHDTGDGDLYEDVCVVPEGDIDAVYVLVNRGGNRYVERFASRLVTDVRLDALFLDSFLSYNGRNTTSITLHLSTLTDWTVDDEITVTASAAVFVAGDVGNAFALLDDNLEEIVRIAVGTYVSSTVVRGYPNKTVPAAVRNAPTTVWGRAVDQFSGLGHLEGRTVGILADGNVLPQQTVSGGSVTLEYPAVLVHVGLPITAELETLDLDAAELGIRDRKKKINGLSILIDSSRGGFIGPDADNLREMLPPQIENLNDVLTVRTEIVEYPITATWEDTGRVLIQQTDPLPLAVMAVIPSGEIGG